MCKRRVLFYLSLGLMLMIGISGIYLKILIKADDFNYPTQRWLEYSNYLRGKNIKSTLGIIALSVGDTKTVKNFIDKNKDLIEIWNHGLKHNRGRGWYEFTQSEKQQIENITKANKILEEMLDQKITMFGAPFNAINKNTENALVKTNMKYWLLGRHFKGNPKNNIIILGDTDLVFEFPYFHPNFKKFKAYYEKNKNKDVIVAQIHPNSWKGKQFEEFKKIIEFLSKEKNVSFIHTKDL